MVLGSVGLYVPDKMKLFSLQFLAFRISTRKSGIGISRSEVLLLGVPITSFVLLFPDFSLIRCIVFEIRSLAIAVMKR